MVPNLFATTEVQPNERGLSWFCWTTQTNCSNL